jgi:glutamate-ammonia-ligase adenylyltransferase
MTTIDPRLADAPWPRPARPERVARETERLVAAARELVAAARDQPERAAGLWLAEAAATAPPLLAAVFGNSPFLSDCLALDPGFAAVLLRDGPERAHAHAHAAAEAALGQAAPLGSVLRQLRRRVALTVAVADIGGLWDLAQVTGVLSDFADGALQRAAAEALREAAARGGIASPHPEQPERDSGLVVLADGQARRARAQLLERHRSDRAVRPRADLDHGARPLAAGLSCAWPRRIVQILEERTGRRLRRAHRPAAAARSRLDAASRFRSRRREPTTRPSARTGSARHDQGEARPAGDRAPGDAFLEPSAALCLAQASRLRAIQDIHSIKRQINAQRGGGAVTIAGHNLKLGRGGIREIEFFAQTNQLIWGGRIPALRRARHRRGAAQASPPPARSIRSPRAT